MTHTGWEENPISQILYGKKMNILSYTVARASFKQTMDDVCLHHDPTVITRQRGEPIVMMSLADYNSMEETMYLLSNSENARRLMESVEQIKTSDAQFQELISVQAEEQASS